MSFRSKFTPKYMLLLLVSVPFASYLYYWAWRLLNSPLSFFQYFQFSVILTAVVTWWYQFYFWIQRNSEFFESRSIKIWLDDLIPFWPSWIWIYSFLYYIGIGFVVVSVQSIENGVALIFWGLMLLTIQVACFFFFPCHTPIEWRKFHPVTASEKFLYFVQGYDSNKNCFPSMHCSLAMYISMILSVSFGLKSFIFTWLILLSCLFTKQHQILDTIPWVILGYFVYNISVKGTFF